MRGGNPVSCPDTPVLNAYFGRIRINVRCRLYFWRARFYSEDT